MGQLFGTDGIRGVANKDLSCELALKSAKAAASVLIRKLNKKPLVIIGTDTRSSAAMLTDAMSAGFCSAGADVVKIGVVPTPAIPYLIKHYKADIGVMISASHNPAKYNGIKLFDKNGLKLPDAVEDEIEKIIYNGNYIESETLGAVKISDNAAKVYAEYIKTLIKPVKAERKLTAVIDCANGAAYSTAAEIFSKLDIYAKFINREPDGLNINKNCGSTHMDELSKLVKYEHADIGIAFDGDADRCLICDEKGRVLDGDRIIAALALDMKKEGLLKNSRVAVTTMSNMGFLNFMEQNGIECEQTRVGDRYVLEAMQKDRLSLGGEQSGHIILLDNNTTGDGQLTAVMFVSLLIKNKKMPSHYYESVIFYPQVNVNIKADKEMKEHLITNAEFNHVVNEKRDILGNKGRIIVRPSGTEPLVRLMVEGDNEKLVREIAGELLILAENIVSVQEN